jgi:hypothetical protein
MTSKIRTLVFRNLPSGYYKKEERSKRIEELYELLTGSPQTEWEKLKVQFGMKYGLSERKINEYIKTLVTLGRIEPKPDLLLDGLGIKIKYLLYFNMVDNKRLKFHKDQWSLKTVTKVFVKDE